MNYVSTARFKLALHIPKVCIDLANLRYLLAKSAVLSSDVTSDLGTKAGRILHYLNGITYAVSLTTCT